MVDMCVRITFAHYLQCGLILLKTKQNRDGVRLNRSIREESEQSSGLGMPPEQKLSFVTQSSDRCWIPQ